MDDELSVELENSWRFWSLSTPEGLRGSVPGVVRGFGLKVVWS